MNPFLSSTGRALAEADERRAWSSLKTKLFIHAMLYGTIALYHLWNSIIDSWRTSLDFSSICTPRVLPPSFIEEDVDDDGPPRLLLQQILLVPGRVCLPDVAAYMPLHVIMPSLVFLLALAIRWGGTFLQLGAFSMLPLILMSIWYAFVIISFIIVVSSSSLSSSPAGASCLHRRTCWASR